MINPFVGIGISVGLIALVAFGTFMTGTFTSSSEQILKRMEEKQKNMEADQKQMKDDQEQFTRTWIQRQQDENKFNNETEHQMIGLQRNASVILKQQIANEQNIIGNLSSHRIITNLTYDKQSVIQNKTETLANQTNTLLKFLVDNFGSQSGYLEKENFQYDQANKTFDNTNKTLGILNNGPQIPK